MVVLNATFLWWLSPWKKIKISIGSFLFFFADQRILQYDWTSGTNDHMQPKVVGLRCYFSLMIVSMQKSKILIDSFPDHWWSKNPAVWLNKRHNWPHQTKFVAPDANFLWWLSQCKNSKILIDSFQRYWWSHNLAICLAKRYN